MARKHRALFRIGAEDVSLVRFGVSPAHELAVAVRVMLAPAAQPVHWGWLRSLRGRVPAESFDLVAAVVGGEGYFPDFLTRTPEWDTTPETDLDRLRATPDDEVAQDLQRVLDHRPPLPGPAGARERRTLLRLAEDPARGRAEIATAWERLWDAVMAPDWERVERLLQADIGRRVRHIAEVGVAGMVDGLHAHVSWGRGAVRVETISYSDEVDCAGSGLVLVPSVMTAVRCSVLTHVPERPAIFYPALGVTERWQRPRDPRALAGVLGEGRARVLACLDGPRSTGEVGEVCELAISTASHHLGRLREAGLVDSRRDGGRVLHARSAVGEALVGASG